MAERIFKFFYSTYETRVGLLSFRANLLGVDETKGTYDVLDNSGLVLLFGVSFNFPDLLLLSFISLSCIKLLLDLYLLLPVDIFDFKDWRLLAKLCPDWSTLFPIFDPLRDTLMFYT